MSTKIFPSLSEEGWISDTRKKADKMMSCYFTSDYSQDYINYGDIKSFSYLLAQHYHEPRALAASLEQDLTEYFSRHFNNVVVEASEVENIEDPSHAAIKFSLNFQDSDGSNFDLARFLEYEGVHVRKIIDISNG